MAKKDSTERLLELKDELQEAKIEKATLEGGIKQSLTNLKEEHGVSTLEKARTKLDKLKEKKKDLTEALEEAVEDLEGGFNW